MKKIYLLLTLLCGILISACSTTQYTYSSAKVEDYLVDQICINVEETYSLNILEQFKNTGIIISKYHLEIKDKNIAELKNDQIIAKKMGITSLSIEIYEKEEAKIHTAKVADVFVVNELEMSQITTADELARITENMSGRYILKNDIDLAGLAWQPIGNDLDKFNGMLINKDGYKIKNLTIDSSSQLNCNPTVLCSVGLFQKLENAYIDGIILENININVQDHDISYVGAIAGIAGISLIRNCHIDGVLFGSSRVAGIAGSVSSNFIINCSFNGNLYLAKNEDNGNLRIGGIIASGQFMFGAIIDCHVTGEISSGGSEVAVGGIAGLAREKDLIDCTFIGTLLGPSATELIGYLD